MTTQKKHTPEPWEFELSWSCDECKFFDINKKGTSFGEQGHHIAGADEKEDLKRIVSCVNALAGIPDPEEFVKASKGLVLSIKSVLQIWGSDEGLEKSILKKAIARAEDAFGKTRKEEI